jgi:hypothetical protein
VFSCIVTALELILTSDPMRALRLNS